MGGGIAMSFLNAGFPVTLLETRQDALDKGKLPADWLREQAAVLVRIYAQNDGELALAALVRALVAALEGRDTSTLTSMPSRTLCR